MDYAIGIVVLVVGLLVSIGLHELGHLIPAKAFGVRVPQYMIGFGPTLWSVVRGETEYGLKAIPLGGYCKLVGMLPSAEVVGTHPRGGAIGRLVQDARDAGAEEILPGEEHRAFYRLSTPKKLIVMAGGTFANLFMGFILLAIAMVGIGLPGAATRTVAVVGECIQPLDASADRSCTDADRPTPAAAAGIRPGDVLVSFAGQPIEKWADFQAAVRESSGAAALVVEREGELVTLVVDPVLTPRPVYDEAGEPVLDDDGDPVIRTVRHVGISPTSAMERQPLAEVLPATGEAVWGTMTVVATLPVQLTNLVVGLVQGTERRATVFGLVGAGQVAGEIGSSEGFSLEHRILRWLSLLASLNIALFVFNLIPLVPLDGGHFAGALWEGAKRQYARLRDRPRPAPADMARMTPVAYGVFAALVLMSLVLVVADLVAPISLS